MARIAYFLTHPIQYQSPLIRRLVAGGIDLEIVYATDITARGYQDAGFGQTVVWDVPLLDGYPHRVLFPDSPLPAGLKDMHAHRAAIEIALDDIKPDVVWVHGWGNSYPLAAMRAARRRTLPVLLRGETYLGSLHGGMLRRMAHRLVLKRLFKSVSHFLAIGAANRDYYRAHGIRDERISLMPYAVDNAFFKQRCREAAPNRERLRADLGIEPDRPVILFCAKLIAVKDPATLIRAVGMLAEHRPQILLVGDGQLRSELESLATRIAPCLVKFLGFRNQTELPAFYDLCDLFVLPSTFEPWGLVVNEVMNAGKPVIVSDAVGGGPDLIIPGQNGDVFRAGNVDDLCRKLLSWVQDAGLRKRGGERSLEIINRWSFEEDVAGLNAAMAMLGNERTRSISPA